MPYYRKLSICFLLLIITVTQGVCSEGGSAGSTAGNSFMGQVNSADKVNARINQPMTSASTPMRTFGPTDQQQTFTSQLTAPSSDSFLDIFVQPGSTGDIQTMIIKQDTDFDGGFDYAYTVPIIVSGVCVNGFISCQQGTWNQCRYFYWKVDDALKVSVQEKTDINGLAGCFCINSSCGSNLVWSNMDYVLTTLGGGVVSFIQQEDPHVTITSVKSDITYIRYYGQKTSEIGEGYNSSGVYFSGMEHPEIYYGGDFSGDDERVKQMGSSDSPYSIMTNSFSNRMNPKETKNCVINRFVEFSKEGTPSITLNETCTSLALDGCTVNEEKICDYYNKNCVQSYKNGAGTGLVPVSNIVGLKSPTSVDWYFDTNGSSITYIRTDDAPAQTGVMEAGSSLWWNINRTYTCDSGITFNVDDGANKADAVMKSTSWQAGTLNYTEDGTQRNVELSLDDDNGVCEKSCKVIRPAVNTQVGASGGTWEYQNDVSSTETVYKACVEGQCPLEDGEVIDIDCACLNDFGEAASVLQSMEEAGKDIICSGD